MGGCHGGPEVDGNGGDGAGSGVVPVDD